MRCRPRFVTVPRELPLSARARVAGTCMGAFSAGVRPISELRAGIWRIRERWEAAAGKDATAVLGDHALGFAEADEPSIRTPSAVDGPAMIGAAWFAPTGVPLDPKASVRRLVHGEETVGWVIPAGEAWRGPHENGPTLAIDGIPLRGTFDLLTALEQLLSADCADFSLLPIRVFRKPALCWETRLT